jgi:hypothetical protein
MRGLRRLALGVLLAACACGDDGGGLTPQPDAMTGGSPDAMTGGADAGANGIPLVVWVDDLVEHRTTDEAEPDTVDDKVVIDSEDPDLFNHWLEQPTR